MPWKERFRHAQLWACFKRCPSNEITSFDSDSSRSRKLFVVYFVIVILADDSIKPPMPGGCKRSFADSAVLPGVCRAGPLPLAVRRGLIRPIVSPEPASRLPVALVPSASPARAALQPGFVPVVQNCWRASWRDGGRARQVQPRFSEVLP